jgi:hypothetical protein
MDHVKILTHHKLLFYIHSIQPHFHNLSMIFVFSDYSFYNNCPIKLWLNSYICFKITPNYLIFIALFVLNENYPWPDTCSIYRQMEKINFINTLNFSQIWLKKSDDLSPGRLIHDLLIENLKGGRLLLCYPVEELEVKAMLPIQFSFQVLAHESS